MERKRAGKLRAVYEARRLLKQARIYAIDAEDSRCVEMLVTNRWLTESDCDDRKKISAALGAMVTEAAKRRCFC